MRLAGFHTWEPGNETGHVQHAQMYLLQASGELLCEDLEDFDFSFETPPMSTAGS